MKSSILRTIAFATFFVASISFISIDGCFGSPIFFFNNTPYYSTADIPSGFYAGGSPTFLEDFEDHSLDGGITVSGGSFQNEPWIDSVDADDGTIDGSGSNGKSWVSPGKQISFSFSEPLPTAAALVLTDANPGSGNSSSVQFEAFGPNMVSLGTFGPIDYGDDDFYGKTNEDRFFGIQDQNGILAIKMTNITGLRFEVDHVQYGSADIVLCMGDFDHDGDVDGSDLAKFVTDFGRIDCYSNCEGDFDHDGDVDGSDLAIFATDFGKTGCTIL